MKNRMIYLLLFILLGVGSYYPQTAKINYAEKIKNNPAVVKGKFKNGLTYYILQNKKPEKRAELRLVVNAGSILEDDDQQGLAHFTEHMAFNGTKNFKKQEIVNFLESIGMRFGPELNAYTSFDETVYMLQMPTENMDVLEKGFKILGDWAHNISFENDEIDKERGVIVEEWRLGRGAQARISDKQLPILLKGSRYAERLPIGKKDIIESFKYDKVKKFYKDWYRPDLMAVVAVGDFDVKQVEKYIKDIFEKIPAVKNPRVRKTYSVPEYKETFYSIASDKELPMSNAGVAYKHKPYSTVTLKDFREDALAGLFSGMINERLSEIQLKPDAPFVMAGVYAGGRAVRALSLAQVAVIPKDNNIEKGLNAALVELERVKKFGFTETELERQKKEYLRGLEDEVKEKGKRESATLIQRLIDNYLAGETYPNEETNFDLGKEIVPAITLKEVNDYVKQQFPDYNRVVLAAVPDKPEIAKPTQEMLEKIINGYTKEKIEPYVDKTLNEDLIPFAITPGKIVAESKDEKTGITELKLSNGATVLLKPTDFKNDEILYSAFSRGGRSLYDVKDNLSIMEEALFNMQSGVGKFSLPELSKYLTGKKASASTSVDVYSESASGNSSVKDLETMFKLNYLNFTQPRKDSAVFKSTMSMLTAFLKNKSDNPANVFSDSTTATIYNYSPWRMPVSMDRLKEINYDKGYKLYKERFANAGDFTFVFVGNFTLDTIKPLIEKYIASLPSTGEKENYKDVGIRYPKGIINKEIKKGIEPKSSVELFFTGDMDWSMKNEYEVQSLAELMNIKLRESIREEKGGTYGVSVSGAAPKIPYGRYIVAITFGCQPQRAEELSKAVLTQIDSLKNYPVSAVYINKVKEAQLKSLEKNSKENGAWLNWITSALENGITVEQYMPSKERIESLTPQVIMNTAKRCFNMDNYIKMILYPEK